MSRVYDNWEKLVGAVLNREELTQLAFSESFSSSISADFSSRLSSASALEAFHYANSSRHGLQQIKFKEIEKATRNFQPYMWLGQGQYGSVFKGWIDEHTLTASEPGTGIAVAVNKRKLKILQEREEWLEKINHVGQLCHPNLVKLIGSSEEYMILVYEFMAKGSLENHLFRRGHQSISWETRIKVAKDAARALSFLHEMGIIHGDIKTANILLGGEFNAKLSVFNLAGVRPNMTDVPTYAIGSSGYAAPEYLAKGPVTTKCDVYSFGVVLLELLSGLQVLDVNRPFKEQNLVKWAKPFLADKRKFLQIMDTRVKGQYSRHAAHRVSELAAHCVSTEPEERPSIVEVVDALQQLY